VPMGRSFAISWTALRPEPRALARPRRVPERSRRCRHVPPLRPQGCSCGAELLRSVPCDHRVSGVRRCMELREVGNLGRSLRDT
jgi:hypothetical protein